MGLTEILMFEWVGVAIDECSVRGEVQVFLNFVLQGFRLYDILAALSGEKEERKTASCGNGIICAWE